MSLSRLHLPHTKLVNAMPDNWDFSFVTPGADPRGVSGNYVPLVYVDGVTVSMSLPDALKSGLVSVPLVVQTVRAESDIFPNATVAKWGWPELEKLYFNATFGAYPAGTQDIVNKYYGQYSGRFTDPQLAFYEFCEKDAGWK